ncbi:SRPBCC family protein [Natronospira bacteriovora]|uniref:SRPBCC domain-containing protein n=1 Tax=Natronospira bacteriovora TaxID=3069753 RepID=A0ABU0WA05_9GAMM|nr:SRPBCC domain-containing protein [Natronospira sp. AB-CW4]MDQ2070270.1 SRPBCC domain-containing protein [Natronospira sp. AB-CW4]
MSESLSLCLERTIEQPVNWVYAAWIRTTMLKAWFGFQPEDRLEEAIMELRPGGAFHWQLHQQDGHQVHYRGRFEEVVPERRLCFTWPAYGIADFRTRVGLDLAPEGRGCLLVLLHDGLRDRKMHDHYQRGWGHALDRLVAELPGIRQRQ